MRQQFQATVAPRLPVATSGRCSHLPRPFLPSLLSPLPAGDISQSSRAADISVIFFFLLAASSLSVLFFFFFFFKKHHHTYIDIILVFYGLKMTHSRGGVSCAFASHCQQEVIAPGCLYTASTVPPAHKHTTTSRVMGALAVDIISTATASCDPPLPP